MITANKSFQFTQVLNISLQQSISAHTGNMSCDFRALSVRCRHGQTSSKLSLFKSLQVQPYACCHGGNQNHPASCVGGQNISSMQEQGTNIFCHKLPSWCHLHPARWRFHVRLRRWGEWGAREFIWERGAATRRGLCLFLCLGSSKWSASVSLGTHKKLVETSDHVLGVVHPRVRKASSVCD